MDSRDSERRRAAAGGDVQGEEMASFLDDFGSSSEDGEWPACTLFACLEYTFLKRATCVAFISFLEIPVTNITLPVPEFAHFCKASMGRVISE